ncbi:MAG: hypothetical protein V4474_00555 [Patescibacteria group bacterium]
MIADTVTTLLVGLLVSYFATGRLLALWGRDTDEPELWRVWRALAGIACLGLILLGCWLLDHLATDPVVQKFCNANGLNPRLMLAVLSVVAIASAILNAAMEVGYWNRLIGNFNRALTLR